MTIKELLEIQKATGDVMLIRQGLFYRGYDASADVLHRIFGWQINERELRSCGWVRYVGFPAQSLDKVLWALEHAGGVLCGEATDSPVVVRGAWFVTD